MYGSRNAGTMTMRTPNKGPRPTDLVTIAPDDAQRIGVARRERVRLGTRHCEAVLPVEVSDKMRQGELFASFQDPAVFLNFATRPVRDRFTQACEFKVTAVQIEKLS